MRQQHIEQMQRFETPSFTDNHGSSFQFNISSGPNSASIKQQIQHQIKEYDVIVTQKINLGVKQAMTQVLKKLDDLLHQKIRSINKVNDEIIDCCIVKMNDVEDRGLKRSLEIKKELQELKQQVLAHLKPSVGPSLSQSTVGSGAAANQRSVPKLDLSKI